jgi:hypothetical protein
VAIPATSLYPVYLIFNLSYYPQYFWEKSWWQLWLDNYFNVFALGFICVTDLVMPPVKSVYHWIPERIRGIFEGILGRADPVCC